MNYSLIITIVLGLLASSIAGETTKAPVTEAPDVEEADDTGNDTTITDVTTTYVMTTTPKTPKGNNTYSYGDGNGTCVALQADVNVTFNYTIEGTKKLVKINSTAPDNGITTVSGHCGDTKDILTLDWTTTDDSAEITVTFTFNKTKTDFSLTNVSVTIAVTTNNTDKSWHYKGWPKDKLTSDVNTTYRCAADTDLVIGNANITLHDLKMQAFMNKKNKGLFDEIGTNCDSTSAIVPIAVGAALAAMVLIVLVGYCIGRRRQAAGYTSMNA